MAQMVKNLSAMQETLFYPWVRKIPWRREWLPTPVFLPGEFHGQRSLVGYSSWSHKELDMTEQLTGNIIIRGAKNHQSITKFSFSSWQMKILCIYRRSQAIFSYFIFVNPCDEVRFIKWGITHDTLHVVL